MTRDEEGLVLSGVDQARQQAATSALDIMSSELRQGRLCLACRIDVDDEQGQTVASVPFRELVTITGL